MSKRIGLALCHYQNYHKLYLFETPTYSLLYAGDSVIVDTQQGQNEAEVVAVIDEIDVDSSYFAFIVACTEAKLPLKRVLQRERTVFDKFNYPEGDDSNAENSP